MADKTQRKPQTKAKKKKPWAAPRVKSGRLFESNSLACSKAHYTSGDDACAQETTIS